MAIENLNEHLKCFDYGNREKAVFKVYEEGKGYVFRNINTLSSIVFFLMDGDIELCVKAEDRMIVHKGNMVFFPYNILVSAEAVSSVVVLTCEIEDLQFCNRYGLAELEQDCKLEKELGANLILPIRKYVDIFLTNLRCLLEEQLGCFHLLIMKRKEFFLLMRAFYTKVELWRFFSSIVGIDEGFRQFVLDNYAKVKDVKELAEKRNMTITTFYRHFSREFKKTPGDWMKERRSENVFYVINSSTKTLEEIAYEFGFSSVSHLSSFCRRRFLKSPSQLRHKSK